MTVWAERTVRWGAVAALAAAALSGCSLRAETPPLERRTPLPEVVVRDDAAVREQAVVDAASDGSSTLAAVESVTAPVRLEVLGPVYVATPGATPSPTPVELSDAVLDARDGALAAAAATPDEELAVLLRATALGHSLALAADFVVTPDGWPEMTERLAGVASLGDALTPVGDPSVDSDELAGLALVHDRAAFAYEVAAARAADDERTAWLERSALHRARAEALLAVPGVEDRRDDLYDVPPEAVADTDARIATARATETALGERYAALWASVGGPEDGWLCNAAYDAYAAAFALPGFDVADVPALAGVAAVS
ncbi:hypothetical protein QQX10_04130 [Demequina sp. SYSU T00039]|uniref:DUF4439 domain-containing protein n=1 Tax=Demequina lignilytica TaxID=3051663 RepID=A0AAW7M789_9MICO|nr:MULTISPECIES: hypothetical protein [unclassified Demequina]MDN4477180.1 hypothetical protein [Demequina sp. SYSU T00039-1]MDN4487353.1 hypothetical protein [Demequina sp. SYSU T00039]MDN4491106.1 hypothetical protein [Demequina sp. SYSU T00068]